MHIYNIRRLALMIKNREIIPNKAVYNRPDCTSRVRYQGSGNTGFLEILTSGKFYHSVDGEAIETYDLVSAELHMFNHWISPENHNLNRKDHEHASRMAHRDDVWLNDEFEYAGFEKYHTGGGCMAYMMDLPNGCYVLVSSDLSLPETYDEECSAGLHHEDGDVSPLPNMTAREALAFFSTDPWQALRCGGDDE